MHFTLIIDDADRDEPGAEGTPYTLTLYRSVEGESTDFASGGCIVGSEVPSMLRQAADQWP